MRVLVVTVVHVPLDARIHGRQIAALLDAGHEVEYAAPWSGYGLDSRDAAHPGLVCLDLPRATGRRRFGALLAARRLVHDRARDVDLILLHDPELLSVVAGRRPGVPVVWDVHEDTAAALVDKPWLPRWTRPVLRRVIRTVERWAERRLHLLLAEEAYQTRFRRSHPLVPNTPVVPEEVPPPADRRAVYLGRISRLRGAAELVAVARAVAPDVAVDVIGQADDDVVPMLEQAQADGVLTWHGFVPNEQALDLVAGARVGLSLLHDLPNYRASLPTKVLEYLGRAVPVVTTPLPAAARIVERHAAGIVVPFGDVGAAAAAVRRLADDADEAAAMGKRGHAAVLGEHSWNVDGPAFVRRLEAWAAA